MLKFFCGKSAFQLFTGEVLASGIMLKEHVLVCQSGVRSQLLDTTWRWRLSTPRWELRVLAQYHPAGSQTLCQINLQAKFGGPTEWECVGLVTFNSKPHWKRNDGIILHLRVARFLSGCFQPTPTNNWDICFRLAPKVATFKGCLKTSAWTTIHLNDGIAW